MAEKILIRMPNWLGDAIMATPAIDIIIKERPGARLYMLASQSVCEMFRDDDRFEEILVDISKKHSVRLEGIREQAREINERYEGFDLCFILTNSTSTSFMCRLIDTKERIGAKVGLRNLFLTKAIAVEKDAHQAVKYAQIVNGYFKTEDSTGKTSIRIKESVSFERPTVGISPGAAYGGAKRWESHKFAEVALRLSADYDIVILGAPNETPIAQKIEEVLIFNGVKNYRNLVGKTSMAELMAHIKALNLFICNDSGPMHIAGALDVPTVAIFGPTNYRQTYQWGNPAYRLVRHDIECAPCMKRECPLGHHECMKLVTAQEVLEAARGLLREGH